MFPPRAGRPGRCSVGCQHRPGSSPISIIRVISKPDAIGSPGNPCRTETTEGHCENTTSCKFLPFLNSVPKAALKRKIGQIRYQTELCTNDRLRKAATDLGSCVLCGYATALWHSRRSPTQPSTSSPAASLHNGFTFAPPPTGCRAGVPSADRPI